MSDFDTFYDVAWDTPLVPPEHTYRSILERWVWSATSTQEEEQRGRWAATRYEKRYGKPWRYVRKPKQTRDNGKNDQDTPQHGLSLNIQPVVSGVYP